MKYKALSNGIANMNEINKDIKDKNIQTNFFDNLWEKSLVYIKTVVDVVHEPVLILDKDLRIVVANESFYSMFQVEPKACENKLIYELGNGEWDIPALRKLLEDILPKNTFFKGFEVAHEFPSIGHKIMILNARQIHTESETAELFPPIIMLAMEDITDIISIAERLVEHTNQFEIKMAERTRKIELHISAQTIEIDKLKNK